MLKINVRQFNRKMYPCLKDMPFVVYNKKTGVDLFVVYPVKGGAVDAVIQSDRQASGIPMRRHVVHFSAKRNKRP